MRRKQRYRQLQQRLDAIVDELTLLRRTVAESNDLLNALDPRVGAEGIHDTIRRWTGCKTVWNWPADAGGPRRKSAAEDGP